MNSESKKMFWTRCVMCVMGSLLAIQAVNAEVLTIQGPDKMRCVQEGYWAYQTANGPYGYISEYWPGTDYTTYDTRSYMSFDLSDIPAGATINSVSLKLKQGETGYNGNHSLHLWKLSQSFTNAATRNTYDGIHAWTYGNEDGVDGYEPRAKADGLLMGASSAGASHVYSWVPDFTSAALTNYIQEETNQAAGSRFADFQLTWTDQGSNADFVWFYMLHSNPDNQPRLVVDYTAVPEPVSFVLLGIGAVMGVIRRRK